MKTQHKRFCLWFGALLLTLLVFNLSVWHFCTRQLLTRHQAIFTGDLARLSYLNSHAVPRRNPLDLPKRHLEYSEYVDQPVDMVTVGDSISQGGGYGPNRYYQDFIATHSNLSVLNFAGPLPATPNYIDTVILFLNSGLIRQVGARYVLLEIVERNCSRLASPVNFEKSLPLQEITKTIAELEIGSGPDEPLNDLPPVGVFNTGNLKWLVNNFLFSFTHNALSSKVYKYPLDRPLFSGDKGDELLFYYKDMRKFTETSRRIDEQMVDKINANLNQLADRLAQHGVTLIFMPVVDKSSLYASFIPGKPLPQSPFFELLRQREKNYQFIDTKAILSPEVKKGTQDVFWKDDSHWSPIAPEIIFKQVVFD